MVHKDEPKKGRRIPKVKYHKNDGSFPIQLALNHTVKYNIPAIPYEQNLLNDIGPILSILDIYVSPSESFTIKVRELFEVSPRIYYSDELAKPWFKYPTKIAWAEKLNFAVWASTSGCGISYAMLLDDNTRGWPRMVSSFLRFHVAFTIRRILYELGGIQGGLMLPDDTMFDRRKCEFDKAAFSRLKLEFGVDRKEDFIFEGSPNGGMGSIYTYGTYSQGAYNT